MSVEVDLSQFVAGGYFLTKPFAHPAWFDKWPRPKLPEHILTLSDLTDFLPGCWAFVSWMKGPRISKSDRKNKVQEWGISPRRTASISRWVKSHFIAGDIGWINVFYSADLARAFVRRFDVPKADLFLVGIGLCRDDVNRFVEDARPPERSHERIGADGVYEMVSKGCPLTGGGTPVGYEPLTLEAGGFHSWLCASLHEYAFIEKGICPNIIGLLDNHEDARWVADQINEGKVNAEPGLYLPWLVMTYPLK